ncbi:MAG: hypothetical protein J5494_02850, partial [Candidatus Methanomethylophilaceae archaeon]|nr:hypothetical protein [Candidatus Methanomethylophilaceae archaeon]
SELSVAIDSVADLIIKTSEGKQPLYDPRPLDDDQMTDLAAGRPVRPGSPEKIRDPCSGCGRRRSIKGTRIMDSCAAFGAMAAFMKLTDWTVLLQGPESCMYLMEMSRGGMSRSLYPESAGGTAAALRVCCTMMDDSASIFGGTGKLKEKLEELCGEGCGKIAVVTTCMPGIIGDHSADAIEHIRKKYPGKELALIEADGDIAGDYTDGFRMAVREITGMIDPSVRPERRYVNLVGISFFDLQSPGCMAELAGILSVFGLKINCRFLDDCPSGDIRMFCRAETDILLSGSPSDLSIMGMISERTGRKPFPRPLPIGMKDYGKWLEAMGKFAGMEEEAAREWKNAEEKYDRYVKNNRKVFEGKKIIIIDRLKRSCVWAAELLADLGAEIVRIGCFSRCGEPGMTCPERFGGVTVENYSPKMLEDDLESLDPDLLICDLLFRTGKKCRTARIGRSGVGPGGVLRFADYVGNVLRLPATEGWKEDGE